MNSRDSISPPATVSLRALFSIRESLIRCSRRCIRSWSLPVSLDPAAHWYMRYPVTCKIHNFSGKFHGLLVSIEDFMIRIWLSKLFSILFHPLGISNFEL